MWYACLKTIATYANSWVSSQSPLFEVLSRLGFAIVKSRFGLEALCLEFTFGAELKPIAKGFCLQESVVKNFLANQKYLWV